VSRDGWGADADWIAFDSGPHGVMNGGHAHADALAFDLVVGGQPVFVDAGTFSYPGPERNLFRDGAAHNTVTVDGASSSVPAVTPFQWVRSTDAHLDRWHSGARATFMGGWHDGFASLPVPARHRREILHLAGDYWVVRDRIESEGAHEVVVRFHCAPGLRSCLRDDATLDSGTADISSRGSDAPLLRLAIFGQEGALAVEDGWVSRQYGMREASRVVVWRQSGTAAQEIITFLLPADAQATIEAHELTEVRGGRGFRLVVSGAEDILLVGDGGLLGAEGVETDAEWLWLRRDSAGRILEYVALGASFGRVGGKELWTPAGRLAWRASTESELQRARTSVGQVPTMTNSGSGAS
jgi:hypothetical protein